MSEDKAMVIFQPSGRRGEVPKGTTIIEASRLLGVDIEALCGEKKVCGKCVVRIEDGHFEKYGIQSSMSHVSPWQEEAERREKGFRLGCVATVEDDILVFVPEESRAGKQVVSKAARDIFIEHNPAIKLYYVKVDPPSFEEPTGDFERICRGIERDYGLNNLTIDLFALRQLPDALRNGKWEVTVRIDTVSMMNPQCKYGEDVMARITYHMTTPDGLQRMSDDIIEGTNELIDKAIANTFPPKKKVKKKKGEEGPDEYVEVPEEGKTYLRLTREDIEDITIGFNTAMHHIFLSLNPEHVGMAPFPPVIHHSLDIRARDLGIKINPSSYMFVLPIEAGFVGADNVGVLIAEEPYKHEENQLIIDIGCGLHRAPWSALKLTGKPRRSITKSSDGMPGGNFQNPKR